MLHKLRQIYMGLKAWKGNSGFTYSQEYGCAVDESTAARWEQHLAEHPAVKAYRNCGWELFPKMAEILDGSTAVKGTRTFAAHNEPAPSDVPLSTAASAASASVPGIEVDDENESTQKEATPEQDSQVCVMQSDCYGAYHHL